MAKTLVVWNGLDTYRAAMRTLPDTVTGEAAKLIEGYANATAATIKAAYPVRTGKLRDKLTVTHQEATGRYKAASVIKNTAKHAVWFESGTQARHTSLGANRGSMPPGRIFVPAVVTGRRRATEALKALVLRHGATTVSGGE
jgi:hypothetical protein